MTTFSFDMDVKEFGIPLFNELTVTIGDEDQGNKASTLCHRIKERKTNFFQTTPYF